MCAALFSRTKLNVCGCSSSAASTRGPHPHFLQGTARPLGRPVSRYCGQAPVRGAGAGCFDGFLGIDSDSDKRVILREAGASRDADRIHNAKSMGHAFLGTWRHSINASITLRRRRRRLRGAAAAGRAREPRGPPGRAGQCARGAGRAVPRGPGALRGQLSHPRRVWRETAAQGAARGQGVGLGFYLSEM